jgi:transcriptional regulator with XRE-family HTH domain
MDPRDTTIGERIMLMRRRRGLSQRELAAMAAMSPTTLNRLEQGLQSVYAERLATLARLLDVSADYLLGLPEPEGSHASSTARAHAEAQSRTPPQTKKRQRTRKAAPGV